MTRPRRAQARGLRRFQRLGAWGFLAAVLLLYALDDRTGRDLAPLPAPAREVEDRASGVVERAFAKRRSDLQVRVRGVVDRVLPDDTRGSQHQRFLLVLEGGHRVLVSHNIDLAPRLEDLRGGEALEVYGEYEWNDRGGVIHWTHHDPAGRHPDGWIARGARRYQ